MVRVVHQALESLSRPYLDAYIVTASLLPMQFTQAVTIGFYAISVKYNESLDATVCLICSVRLVMVISCVSAG